MSNDTIALVDQESALQGKSTARLVECSMESGLLAIAFELEDGTRISGTIPDTREMRDKIIRIITLQAPR